MSSNVLSDLVLEVIKTKEAKELTTEQSRQFHNEFEAKISEKAEEMRAAKRRAFEELQAIAVR